MKYKITVNSLDSPWNRLHHPFVCQSIKHAAIVNVHHHVQLIFHYWAHHTYFFLVLRVIFINVVEIKQKCQCIIFKWTIRKQFYRLFIEMTLHINFLVIKISIMFLFQLQSKEYKAPSKSCWIVLAEKQFPDPSEENRRLMLLQSMHTCVCVCVYIYKLWTSCSQ